MFNAILWDYDGTIADTPVKNIAVTKVVLARMGLLGPSDPLPEALTSLEAYHRANHRYQNWRELYLHAYNVPADRLDEAGDLWAPCQLADETQPPLFDGMGETLGRLKAVPMGICSQNSSRNIHVALAEHGIDGCFAAVVGQDDVPMTAQKPDPASFLKCLEQLGLEEGRFAYIGDHAEDVTFGRNAEAALRARGRDVTVVCVTAAWSGAEVAAWPQQPDAVANAPTELAELLERL